MFTLTAAPCLEPLATLCDGKKRVRVAVAPSRLTMAGWEILKKSAGKNVLMGVRRSLGGSTPHC